MTLEAPFSLQFLADNGVFYLCIDNLVSFFYNPTHLGSIVYRLGQRLFKPLRGVRLPLELPQKNPAHAGFFCAPK